MSMLSRWANYVATEVNLLWAKVPEDMKATIRAAGSALEKLAITFVEAEAGKLISGEVKLNNVGADLIAAGKGQGYTIALDLGRTLGQEAFMDAIGSKSQLVAGPNDPPELHAAIDAANAKALADLVAAGKVTSQNAVALSTPTPAAAAPAA